MKPSIQVILSLCKALSQLECQLQGCLLKIYLMNTVVGGKKRLM
uniref:Uncharacterized protein n=1 Tax=Arundo donax TaxID=35708 RepID=A0A0A9CG76_ARUDO